MTDTDYSWAIFPDTCPLCGGIAEYFTKIPGETTYACGAKVRCKDCRHEGEVGADGNEAYVEWEDET
jgi:hypothetical protein